MAEADLQHRDRRGEWLPDPLPAPAPLFSWPLRLGPALRAVVGFFWPYNIFYTALAVVCWLPPPQVLRLCNYGGEIIPLDKWFGSFFDGSRESEVEMRARRRRLKGVST